jgi:hypothetical protein
VINMTRQIGYVLGVSVIVAILGTPTSYAAAHTAFVHGWWAVAAVSLLAVLSARGMTPRPAGPR